MNGMEFGVISDEERTRHESLFFSQGPIDGLLSSDKASELFLESKLSLTVLSRIWNLVDVPRDNMLDAGEFVVAMHLLQWHLRGKPIPDELLPSLKPMTRPVVMVPLLRQDEWNSYKKLFRAIDKSGHGILSNSQSRSVLASSGLCRQLLCRAWNLADVDRDGALTSDEFTIACHLVRHLKKDLLMNGPVNVLSVLPHRLPKTDLATKRARVTAVELQKRRLMALKERRKTEWQTETQRAELWAERLKLLRQQKQDIGETVILRVDSEASRTAAVAFRLKKEYERVRQTTAHFIILEQQLSTEVKQLSEEADTLHKRRQRSSIIKDLDPFHQLYENKKEERITGIRTPKKKPSFQIPHKVNPFDITAVDSRPWLPGEELFECFTTCPSTSDPITNCLHCFRPDKPAHDMSSSPTSLHGPWREPDGENTSTRELTLGFDDDFVNEWSRDAEVNSSPDLGMPDLDKDFAFNVDQDLVFRTVSVTEEEDDLWRSLLVEPHTSFADSLCEELQDNALHLREFYLTKPQILLRNESDYEEFVKEQSGHVTSSPSSRRRAAFRERPKRTRVVDEEAASPSHSSSCRPSSLGALPADTTDAKTVRSEARVYQDTSPRDVFKELPLENGALAVRDSERDVCESDRHLIKETVHRPDLTSSFEPGTGQKSSAEQKFFSEPQSVFKSSDDSVDRLDQQLEHLARTQRISNTESVSPQGSLPTVTEVKPTKGKLSKSSVNDTSHEGATAPVVRRTSPFSRQQRLTKASTWCAADDTPTPPPRFKSPRKRREAALLKSVSEDKSPNVDESNQGSTESRTLSTVNDRAPLQRSQSHYVSGHNVRGSACSPTSRDIDDTVPRPPPRPKRLSKRCKHPKQQTPPADNNDLTKDSVKSQDISQISHKQNSSCSVADKTCSDRPSASTQGECNIDEVQKNFDASTDADKTTCDSAGITDNIITNYSPGDILPTSPYEGPESTESTLLEEINAALNQSKYSCTSVNKSPERVASPSIECISETCPENSTSEVTLLVQTEDICTASEAGSKYSPVTQSDVTCTDFRDETIFSLPIIEDASEIRWEVERPEKTLTDSEQSNRSTGCDEDSGHVCLDDVPPWGGGTRDGAVIEHSQPDILPDWLLRSLQEVCDLSTYCEETDEKLREFLLNNAELLKCLSTMDAASRKRELEILRARYFNTSASETGHESSTHASYPTDTHHRSVTILNINGSEGDSSPDADKRPADLPRQRNPHGTHMTTITISSPTEAGEKSFPDLFKDEEETFLEAEEPALQTLPRSTNYSSRNEECLIDAPQPPSSFAVSDAASDDGKTTKSKIILDLDEFQYRPEFESDNKTSPSESPMTTADVDTGDLLGLGDLSAPVRSSSGSTSQPFIDFADNMKTDRSIYAGTGSSGLDDILSTHELNLPQDVTLTKPETETRKSVTRNIILSESDGNPETAVDDSDISDDENPFEATFDPNAAVSDPQSPGEHNDSGIVLISYEKKRQRQEQLQLQQRQQKRQQQQRAASLKDDEDDDDAVAPPLPSTPPPSHLPLQISDGAGEITSDPSQPSTWSATAVTSSASSPNVDFRIGPDKPRHSNNLGFNDGTTKLSAPNSANRAKADPLVDKPEADSSKMDPFTGLKKVGASTAVEKAFHFAEATEPTVRVRKKSEDGPGSMPIQLAVELEHGRQEIMDSSRVRVKKKELWVPPGTDTSSEQQQSATTVTNISDSQRNYENRKKHRVELKKLPSESAAVTSQAAPLVMTTQSKGGIDPRRPSESQELTSPATPTTIQSWDQSPHSSHHVRPDTNTYESAIEREIRLAREREQELKREREEREKILAENKENLETSSMPIYKVPVVTTRIEKGVKKAEASPAPPPEQPPVRPSYIEMTEADRDSEMLARESIIENEIREQKAREDNLRSSMSSMTQGVKHQDRSDTDDFANRSLIEEEIRQQREREAEIRSRRAVTSPDTVSHRTAAPSLKEEPTKEVNTMAEPVAPTANTSSLSSTDPSKSSLSRPTGAKITYENAISSYAHAGESLIARELREQQERETELRQHWKDMGLEMPELPSGPQTPYQPPEPKVTLESVTTVENGIRRSSVDSQASSLSTASVPQKVEEPRGPKVRPFEDPDEVPIQTMSYMPQNESPIEREIRLAREREEALRQQRGLPPPQYTTEVVDDSVITEDVVQPTLATYRKRENPAARGAMMRISSSCLQHEMKKEKEREEDLRKLGKIRTLSQDDAGQTRKYTEVIPKDVLDGPPPVMKPVKPQISRGFSFPATPAADFTVTSKRTSTTTPPSVEPTSVTPVSAAPVSAAPTSVAPTSATPVTNAPQENGAVTEQKKKTAAPKAQRYVPPPVTPVNKIVRQAPPNESAIERELRELKEREDELKEQRRRTSKTRPPAPPGYHANNNNIQEQRTVSENNGNDIPPSSLGPASTSIPLDQIELRHRHTSAEDTHHVATKQTGSFNMRGSSAESSSKASRRKSTMAEEWERKFGGGN